MVHRVLMTADAVGGVWTYALELARALEKYAVETSVAVLGPAPKGAQTDLDIRHRPYKLEWMEDPWSDVDRAGDWLLNLEQEFQPDIVHLNGYAHGALPFHAPKIIVGHSCVLSWWQAVHGVRAPQSWHEYRRRVARGLRAADLVVTPSFAMRTALARHYGELSATRVIPNGCDFSRFHAGPKRNLIFTAGRLWDRAKNIEMLERVAPALAWPIYAAGQGATTSNTRSNITYLGELAPEEMQEWFSRAAIYALPARYEPFGLSILEAALSGCALVLGDIQSLRENWNGAALFVSPDDEQHLCRRLQSLTEDETLRERLQRGALDRAQKFSVARMTASYLTVYEELCSHRAATFRSSRKRAYSRSRSASGTRQTGEG